ncbi:MAG: divergent polysaccharide deacetylase family protein [Gammaproteobacteria bacterium]
MQSRRSGWRIVCACCLSCLSLVVAADSLDDGSARMLPAIALIIDDLGNQRSPGRLAVTLPGPVACAFLPNGPFTRELASRAHAGRKEVMLHLPMQALENEARKAEPGELTLDMTLGQFRATIEQDIAAVPHVSGLNNHQGSLLTRHPGNMAWLMQAISEHGKLFFVDSRTTSATVARRLAQEYGIPNSERNVFLDNEAEPEAVRAKFRELVRLARRDGTALGIGHPYPATLEVLVEELNNLGDHGVQLIPVARLIELQNNRQLVWQASSSR